MPHDCGTSLGSIYTIMDNDLKIVILSTQRTLPTQKRVDVGPRVCIFLARKDTTGQFWTDAKNCTWVSCESWRLAHRHYSTKNEKHNTTA
mmetsp:Transcript_11086/g.25707  ORF Transcript_11086/g.25707 Transcript_11086/m.25707 type:complete len:90 (-) Transcript_11086:3176-3445(-)